MGIMLFVMLFIITVAVFIPSGKPPYKDPNKHFKENYNKIVGNDRKDEEYQSRIRNEAHQEWINTKREEKKAVWRMYLQTIVAFITLGSITFGDD